MGEAGQNLASTSKPRRHVNTSYNFRGAQLTAGFLVSLFLHRLSFAYLSSSSPQNPSPSNSTAVKDGEETLHEPEVIGDDLLASSDSDCDSSTTTSDPNKIDEDSEHGDVRALGAYLEDENDAADCDTVPSLEQTRQETSKAPKALGNGASMCLAVIAADWTPGRYNCNWPGAGLSQSDGIHDRSAAHEKWSYTSNKGRHGRTHGIHLWQSRGKCVEK